MNWEAEIEIRGGVSLTVGEMQELLISSLTRKEMDEFGGELIESAGLGSPLKFLEEWG